MTAENKSVFEKLVAIFDAARESAARRALDAPDLVSLGGRVPLEVLGYIALFGAETTLASFCATCATVHMAALSGIWPLVENLGQCTACPLLLQGAGWCTACFAPVVTSRHDFNGVFHEPAAHALPNMLRTLWRGRRDLISQGIRQRQLPLALSEEMRDIMQAWAAARRREVEDDDGLEDEEDADWDVDWTGAA